VRLPLSDAERALLREIFVKRPFPRPVKPVKCVKCGQPTLRRLDDSVGICAACER
jgi:ribosomal protein L37AE/L43A